MAKILIVDDRAANRDYLVTLLRYQGHTLLEAEDGNEALTQLKVTPVDLIITDVLMPTMDGYTLVRLLKQNAASANIPVIFYTITYLEHEAQAIAKECGVNYILKKPCEPEEVLSTVNAALGFPAATLNRAQLPKKNSDVETLRLANLRLEALVDLGKQCAVGQNIKVLLSQYGQAAREICAASQVIVALTDNAGEHFTHYCCLGLDNAHIAELPRDTLVNSRLRDIMAKQQACSIFETDRAVETLGLSKGFPPIGSLLAVPIRLSDQSMGWIWLFNKLGKLPFSRDDKEIIGAMASQLAMALQNQALYENLRRQQDKMQAILDNSTTPIYLNDLDGKYLLVNPAFAAIFGVPCEEVIGKTQSELFPSDFAKRLHDDDLDLLDLGRPLQLEQRVQQPDGEHTYIAVKFPLLDEHGKAFGVGGICTDITERKCYEAQLAYMAHHDALTGLANVVLLKDRLEQALLFAKRQEHEVAILFLDLDRFKLINDTLGHGVGDQVLKTLAERLPHCVRANDTVARLGGDEFVIVLSDIGSGHDVVAIVEKLLEATAKPVHVADNYFNLSVSVGISLYPHDGEDVPTLMRNADSAMYRAKAGVCRYQFYSHEMTQQIQTRVRLENGLREGLKQNEFEVFYQPKMDLYGKRVTGFEALLRWHHRTSEGALDWVPPATFIGLAEETGLIVPLGTMVLQRACAQGLAWQQAGYMPLTLAVNVSPRQFRENNLVDVVQQICEETGFDPHQLEIEITESLFLECSETIERTLLALKKIGARIVIDDFGTGYSSLAYLQRFSVDGIKIDQSFIREIDTDSQHAAMVDGIITLAHNLHLSVTAEGVERREQMDFLSLHGCDELQGYFLGRPMATAAVLPMLRQNSRFQNTANSN